MSTYFDIACRDCKVEMNITRDIRDDATLGFFIGNREVFEKIPGDFDVEVKIGGGYIDLHWLKEHIGHRLGVKCEYEDFEKLETRLATGKTWWEYRE
jgi:hypothetical protein